MKTTEIIQQVKGGLKNQTIAILKWLYTYRFIFNTVIFASIFFLNLGKAICQTLTVQKDHWWQNTDQFLLPIWVFIAWLWFYNYYRLSKSSDTITKSYEEICESYRGIIKKLIAERTKD